MAEDRLVAQVKGLCSVLDARAQEHRRLEPYDEGGCPMPTAIVSARVTRAYRSLMPVAEAPWGSLVVDSVQDRLEVSGLEDAKNQAAAERCWELWQANSMDAESKLAHRAAFLDGRAFALTWPDADTGQPAVSLDDATQMVVQYREGSRKHRVAALRRWDEDGQTNATLYRPDGIWKFSRPEGAEMWEPRPVPGESRPVPNPLEAVPVVELAVNRKLKPGSFGYARGEFAHATGMIDRINLLTFLGLVVAFWQGFPLRVLIGEQILYDDDDQPIAPFKALADSVAQFENPDAKIDQYAAADRKNLSVFAELQQFALMCKTPRHYFPNDGGLSNISADTIRADEGALAAKATGHKASLGEGWEEVNRLLGRLDGTDLSDQAEVKWKDHESRSLAERADAATKLASIGLPWQMIAEKALNATQSEIARWEGMAASSALGQLLQAAQMAPQNGVASGQPAAA